ncbi:hypothetical protein [Paraliobacillus sp. X-1268]|uniref:hypothetical protein n=1 Tax=Paraliobacillus sp. X-1268 TaxID=2213193 RepID=UPI000E3E2913|nr:hypothetical protein [Paraliobacillus sp. X-1268]
MEQAESEQILQALAKLKENVNECFDQVDKRFVEVDKRFDKIETRLDRMETKMDKAEENISFLFSEVGSNSLHLKKLISSK